MNPTEIKTRAPFMTLFPPNSKTLNAIVNSMRESGYDPAYPVIVWDGHVIDGHTRLAAAVQANIADVPVVEKTFEDDDEALDYAIHCQRDRRNLTDAELARCVEALDKRMRHGQNQERKEGKFQPLTPDGVNGASSAQTAEALGISQRKVERIRTVNDKASDEIKEKVESGEMSVNQAYNETVKKKYPPCPTAPPSAPPTEKVFGEEKPCDEVGRMVPDECLELWNRRQEVQDLMTRISKIKGIMKAAEDEADELFKRVNKSHVVAHLEQARTEIASAKPQYLCPLCHGDGCRACAELGLVSKFYWDACPSEFREAAVKEGQDA